MDSPFNFSLKGIEIMHTSIDTPVEPGSLGALHFDLRFKATISTPKEKSISVLSDVVLHAGMDKIKVGRFTANFQFEIPDLEKLAIESSPNQFELPRDQMLTLLSISASTLRGMMFGLFKGTFLHNAILPIIDVQTFHPTDEN